MKKSKLLLALSAVVLLGIAATPVKPKPSPADQKILSKTYRVPCLDCDNGVAYRLKPLSIDPGYSGNRSATNSAGVHVNIREIKLKFRCPVKHEFAVRGPDQIVPVVVAEEER